MLFKPDISFSKEELIIFEEKYKFKVLNLREEILHLYHAAYPLLIPQIYYEIICSHNPKGVQERLSFVPYDNYVAAAITLGRHQDCLQSAYSNAGELLYAYILECMGAELLQKLYKVFSEKVQRETGLFVKAYDFLGESFPIYHMPETVEMLKTEDISYNEAFVLLPKNSVVFIAQLVLEKTDTTCGICSRCAHKECLMRE